MLVHKLVNWLIDRTVTRCFSASLTVCSGVFRPQQMLQHVLLLVPDVVSTSRPSWGKFTGCQCDSTLSSRRLFWSTRHWMVCLRNARSLPLLPGRRWPQSSNVATCEVPRTHTSLGDRSFTVAGTTYLFVYVMLNLLFRIVPPVAEDAFVLPRTAVPSGCCF